MDCLNICCILCWLILFSKFSHWSPAKAVPELVSGGNSGFPAGMPLAYLHVELGQPLTSSSYQGGLPFRCVDLVIYFYFYNCAFALYTFPSAYLLLCIISSPSRESELQFLSKTSNPASLLSSYYQTPAGGNIIHGGMSMNIHPGVSLNNLNNLIFNLESSLIIREVSTQKGLFQLLIDCFQ